MHEEDKGFMVKVSLAGVNYQNNYKDYLKKSSDSANKIRLNPSSKVSFGRALKQEEKQDYRETILAALDALGKKNFSLIIHGTSFPSIEKEDTGIGSPNSNGAKTLLKFMETNGFNGLQLGPEGKTKKIDPSPYTSTVFSMNPLFIDLKELTHPEWGKILNKNTLDNIANNKPKNNDPASGSSDTAYNYAYEEHEKALKEAYGNFKQKLNDDSNTVIQSINNKFNAFKQENKSWLESDALYEALSKEHNNDYFPVWNSELDKNLYLHLNSPNDPQKQEAENRKKEIEKKYKNEIELYQFNQFIADEQKQKINGYASKLNIKTISDAQVGFSDRDIWGNKALFMPEWKLGCPPDYFSKDGQAWGFPVLNPKMIFEENGTLGPAGRLLKSRFDRIFEKNPGGVRIDHIIGLIDPWVYPSNQGAQNGDRLNSAPDNPALNQFSHIKTSDFNYGKNKTDDDRVRWESLTEDKINKYAEILEKIIIPSALEKGVSPKDIVCEDLGTLTNPVKKVMEKLREKGIGGTSISMFARPEPSNSYRIQNIPKENTVAVSNHDLPPTALWAENTDRYKHALYLTHDLLPKEKANTKEEFFNKLVNDPKELTKAKFIELFIGPAKNIQIFFSDFFGIKKPYNKPGSSGGDNWLLRLGNNFERFYYDQLTKKEGINLPEILNAAIESKGQKFINTLKDKKIGKFEDIGKLITNLNKYAKILKEPETKK